MLRSNSVSLWQKNRSAFPRHCTSCTSETQWFCTWFNVEQGQSDGSSKILSEFHLYQQNRPIRGHTSGSGAWSAAMTPHHAVDRNADCSNPLWDEMCRRIRCRLPLLASLDQLDAENLWNSSLRRYTYRQFLLSG